MFVRLPFKGSDADLGSPPWLYLGWGQPGGLACDPGRFSRCLCCPQVVKVVGSNISHKLRLSRVKPTDEGTYECRVIDFSDGKARHHKVKAYLRVQPGENSVLQLPDAPPAAPAPPPKPGRELRKRSLPEACSL